MERGEEYAYVSNFNLKEYKVKEYQNFIKENEKTIAEHAPKGWKYIGTYFYSGFGPYTGAQFWEISGYADFDTLRNNDDPTWLKLLEQSIGFGTPEPSPSWLLREVGDTKKLNRKETISKGAKNRLIFPLFIYTFSCP